MYASRGRKNFRQTHIRLEEELVSDDDNHNIALVALLSRLLSR